MTEQNKGFFYTDKRIEDLLQRETRTLRGPCGASVAVEAFRTFWKAYDWLVMMGVHSAESLAQMADDNNRLTGTSFADSLEAIVWASNADMRRLTGIDCFAVRPDGDDPESASG